MMEEVGVEHTVDEGEEGIKQLSPKLWKALFAWDSVSSRSRAGSASWVGACPEPGLTLHPDDVIEVTKRKGDFLYGRIVGRDVDGWFPRALATRISSSAPDVSSLRQQQQQAKEASPNNMRSSALNPLVSTPVSFRAAAKLGGSGEKPASPSPSASPAKSLSCTWPVGDVVLAMWAPDGVFYRACIEGVANPGTLEECYTVRFLLSDAVQPNTPKEKIAMCPPSLAALPVVVGTATSTQFEEVREERKKMEEKERMLREQEATLRALQEDLEARRRATLEMEARVTSMMEEAQRALAAARSPTPSPRVAALSSSPPLLPGTNLEEEAQRALAAARSPTPSPRVATLPSPTSLPEANLEVIQEEEDDDDDEGEGGGEGGGKETPRSSGGGDASPPSGASSPAPPEPVVTSPTPSPRDSPGPLLRQPSTSGSSKRASITLMMRSLEAAEPDLSSPTLSTSSGSLPGSRKGKSVLQAVIASQRTDDLKHGGGPNRAKSSVFTKSVKAIVDWVPTEPGQLPLVRDAVYAVFKEDSFFYEGANVHGDRGKFPKSKVTVLQVGGTLGRQSLRLLSQDKNVVKDSANMRASLSTSVTRRNHLAEEIGSSEASYNEFLKVLLAIKGRLEMTPWSAEVPLLFAHLEPLIQVSDKLCSKWKTILAAWNSSTSCISGPLLASGPFLHAFIDYSTNFNTVCKRYEVLCAGDPKFADFMFSQRWQDRPFLALAVMPVQRVPRYQLLFGELIALTPPEHPDFGPLGEVNTMVKNLAVSINESVRSSEMTQALLERSKSKDILAEHLKLKRNRFVLMHVQEPATIKIEEAKKGRFKVSVFLLSDSLLLALSWPAKDARDGAAVCGLVREEIPCIFWPSGLIFVKSASATHVELVGPLYHVKLNFEKSCPSFIEMLQSEIQKHSICPPSDPIRSGIYDFGERSGCRISYEGDWNANGLMHGRGTLRFSHGSYTGQFERGQMTGVGCMTLSSGDILSGQFVNGVLQGQGTIEYARTETLLERQATRRGGIAPLFVAESELAAALPGGGGGGGGAERGSGGVAAAAIAAGSTAKERFSGLFLNGTREGQGEFDSPFMGTRYVGGWHSDLMHGEGTLTLPFSRMVGHFLDGTFVSGEYCSPDKIVYRGSFTQWTLLQGAGRIEYPNGVIYVGTCRDSLREGTGTCVYPDGSKFEGEWKHDHRVSGTFTGGSYNPVRQYSGTFNEVGMLHGVNGKILYSDGRSFRGTFWNGEPSKGEMTWPSGLQLSGKWKRGLLRGRVVVVFNELMLEGNVDPATNLLEIRGAPPFRLPTLRPFVPSLLYL